jgi:FtsH-binding integral membrane protein
VVKLRLRYWIGKFLQGLAALLFAAGAVMAVAAMMGHHPFGWSLIMAPVTAMLWLSFALLTGGPLMLVAKLLKRQCAESTSNGMDQDAA